MTSRLLLHLFNNWITTNKLCQPLHSNTHSSFHSIRIVEQFMLFLPNFPVIILHVLLHTYSYFIFPSWMQQENSAESEAEPFKYETSKLALKRHMKDETSWCRCLNMPLRFRNLKLQNNVDGEWSIYTTSQIFKNYSLELLADASGSVPRQDGKRQFHWLIAPSPPPPQYRSRDTTPNQLVQSFAHGYGREEEGERRREGGKKREGGREGGIEGGRERKGRGRGGGGVGRRMEGGTDTARNDGFAGSIKSLSSPAAKRERRHGTGIWRGWHQLCNATSSGGTARVPAQLHLVSAAQSSSGAEPRRCQSQHLQECQAPDVTKWSESWMLRIPELASAAALSWGRRCAAAALRHPVKQFEPCRFICRTLLLCNCQATVVKNLYLEKKWIQQAATSELKEVNSAGCNNED